MKFFTFRISRILRFTCLFNIHVQVLEMPRQNMGWQCGTTGILDGNWAPLLGAFRAMVMM
ncbi:MAG: hypothetical protein IPJ29_05885 [Chitinophagaceae bacterium]|nr:hypothetical protein [Chitinophagaceae bacterium]